MKILYYQYYCFYKNLLKDNEPHLLTTLAISASIWFVIEFFVDLCSILFSCTPLNTWISYALLGVVLLNNYIYFHKGGSAKKLVAEKPILKSHKKLTALIAILFFLGTLSFMFWGPVYTKYLLEKC